MINTHLTNELIINCARSWIGTPFHLHGRLKNHQADCIGLIIGVINELNIFNCHGKKIVDCCNYSIDDAASNLKPRLDANFRALDQPQLASIALIQTHHSVNHVGIIADYKYKGFSLIHSNIMRGKIVEHRLSSDFKNSVICYYQIK